MTDRAKKISELTVLTSASGDDLLVIVDDPSGTAVTKKITVSNLFGNSTANVAIYKSAAASLPSATTAKIGTIFFDSDYLYIAVTANSLKRIPLTSF